MGAFLGIGASAKVIQAAFYTLIAFLVLVVVPQKFENSGVRKAQNQMFEQVQAHKKKIDKFANEQIASIRNEEQDAMDMLAPEIQRAYDLYYSIKENGSLPEAEGHNAPAVDINISE